MAKNINDIEELLVAFLKRVTDYNDNLNDDDKEGGSTVPTGDEYNELLSECELSLSHLINEARTLMRFPAHPWPKGTRIVSVEGEWDDDDGRRRDTGPNAVGVVERADWHADQGWTYGVGFPDSGVYVYLDQTDPLTDVTKYRPA